MPYMMNLPRSAARTLALCEAMYNPEETITEYQFDGRDIGINEEDEVVVTYVRRKKRPTHPLFTAIVGGQLPVGEVGLVGMAQVVTP